MRNFTVFFLTLISLTTFAQKQVVKGTVINELSHSPEFGINIINLNSLKISQSQKNGDFQIEANLNDSLHFSAEGFMSLKIKVTNDWIKGNNIPVYIKDSSTVLDELFIDKLKLTGFIQVDTKLIEIHDFYYYKSFEPSNFSAYYNSGLSPIDGIYNSFKKNSEYTKRIEKLKSETELIEIMKTKFDRETASALLNISKEEIVKVLQNCNHTERFIYTASDFQIFTAVNECFQIHNISKK